MGGQEGLIRGLWRRFSALFMLLGGSLIGAGLGFLVQVVLGRGLGAEDFGRLASVLAMVMLLVPVAGLGVSQAWLKLFAQEGWGGRRWLGVSVVLLLMGFGAAAVVLLGLLLWTGWGSGGSSGLVVMALCYLLAQVLMELAASRCQLEERYGRLALWQFWPHLARLLLLVGLWLMAQELDPEGVIRVFLLVAVGMIIAGAVTLLPMSKPVSDGGLRLQGHGPEQGGGIKTEAPSLGALLAHAWPFGVGALLYLLYFQSGVILVKAQLGAEAAGLYHAAFVIVAATYLLPTTLYQKYLLPKIHRWAVQDRDNLRAVYVRGNLLMFLLGLLVAAAMALAAPWLIPLLFGAGFGESVALLVLMCVAVPFRYVATSVGAVLNTGELMRRKIRAMALVALFFWLLGFGLTESLGLVGIVYATVLSDLLLLLLYSRLARRWVFKGDGV